MKRGYVLGSLLLSLAACAHREKPEDAMAPVTLASTPDAIVVLGHRPPLDGAGLEYETRARVDRGVALFHAGEAPRILFSGGPSTEVAIEADVMAQYAEQHGVPSAAVLRERASRDTIENARMSVALLRGELALGRAPRVMLVTSDYHIERASRLFRCAGAEVMPIGVSLDQLSEAERKQRERSERWVRFYYRFVDECTRALGSR